MSDAKLCEPCKGFFRGTLKTEENSNNTCLHHETRESFDIAIELGCAICKWLYAAILAELDAAGQKLLEHKLIQSRVSRIQDYERDWHLPYLAYLFGCNGANGLYYDYGIKLLLKPITGDISRLSQPALSRSTGDDNAMAFLKDQYESCLSLHDKCAERHSTANSLPTRLIDVGFSAEPSVRLCKSAHIVSRVPYAVLSHCWGSVQPLTLTKSSAPQLYKGVAVSTLSLTFQHAVLVTRQFNLRYLWIDSLCIFQDDLRDWQEQSHCMRDVYRNATFCFAATAARNGGDGLFCAWDQPSQFVVAVEENPGTLKSGETLVEPGLYSCSIIRSEDDDAIDYSPLNLRAWVAQERYLSGRIMHFTRDMVYWECQTSFLGESHPDLQRHHNGRGFGIRILKETADRIGHRATHLSNDTRNDIYVAWEKFRTFYAGLNLTKRSDVLVALRGVALDVSEILGDSLVFGLWKSRLLKELTWAHSTERRRPQPRMWRGPSWSWISFFGNDIIGCSDHRDDAEQLAEILSYPIETDDAENWQLHAIRLRCRIIPLDVEFGHDSVFRRIATSTTFNGTETYRGRHCPGVDLDDLDLFGISEKMTIQCQFIILEHEGQHYNRPLRGLLVLPDRRGSVLYNRIGIVRLYNDWADPQDCSASDLLAIYKGLEDQEIQLV